MTHQEYIFVNTLKDIREKLNSRDRYSIIRAAGLLRQRLLDDSPLVHQVNRKYRVPIVFETIDYRIKPPVKPFIQWQNLDGSSFPNSRKVTSNLNQFLKAECLIFDQQEYTVRDIIKDCANIKGGVHSGNPTSDKEQSLQLMDRVLNIGSLVSSLAALRGIIHVVLVSLAPLETAIAKSTAPSGESFL